MAYAAPHRLTLRRDGRDPHRLTHSDETVRVPFRPGSPRCLFTVCVPAPPGVFLPVRNDGLRAQVPSFGKMLQRVHVGVVGASSVGWAICQSDPSSEFIHMFQLRQTR